VLPKEASQARSAWHLFVIRVPERARLREGLEKHGISTAVHYPTPLHRQPAMLAAGARFGDLSLTERLAQEVLSLPLYPEIATETLAFIARHVHDLCVTACRCKEVR
jgi:dTDP-4-amino-4,6-dideoxygalactose transaminase